MGIAGRIGAYRPAVSSPFSRSEGTLRSTSGPFSDLPARPSGCYSNQHRQHPLRVEILDSKRGLHRAFVRPAAGRRDRRSRRKSRWTDETQKLFSRVAYRSSANSCGPGGCARAEKETEGVTLDSMRHGPPGNSHRTPTGLVVSISHLAIVSVDTRNISAVSRCDRPRKLLMRRILKRCSGA